MSTMVVLTPDHPLKPNTSYALAFDPPVSGFSPSSWTTEGSADRNAPRWLSRPTAGAPVMQRSTCRWLRYVDISVPVSEPAIFRVHTRERGDQRLRQEFFLAHQGSIMFPVTENTHYTLKLTAVDFAGNEAKAPGPPIQIHVPAHIPDER